MGSHYQSNSVSALFAQSNRAPPAQRQSAVRSAHLSIRGHPTRTNLTGFTLIPRCAIGNGQGRKGQGERCTSETEKPRVEPKTIPLIKSFAELSYRKATVLPKLTPRTRPTYANSLAILANPRRKSSRRCPGSFPVLHSRESGTDSGTDLTASRKAGQSAAPK